MSSKLDIRSHSPSLARTAILVAALLLPFRIFTVPLLFVLLFPILEGKLSLRFKQVQPKGMYFAFAALVLCYLIGFAWTENTDVGLEEVGLKGNLIQVALLLSVASNGEVGFR